MIASGETIALRLLSGATQRELIAGRMPPR
jgi:hypothetical protein